MQKPSSCIDFWIFSSLRKFLERPLRLFLLPICCLFFLLACASYQHKIAKPRRLLEKYKYQKALKILKPLAEKKGKNQLVYLLDYGMALHLANQYKESTEVFLKAADIAQIKDYTSISHLTSSLLISERETRYKGNDFEKILIHVYLAINFMLLGKQDSALVETRRINEMLEKFRQDGKRDYGQNIMAKYLSAILWEMDKKWDDAYIDYKAAYALSPHFKPLKKDLILAAYRARRHSELRKWKKTFSPSFNSFNERSEDWLKKPNYGELVVIYQQGWIPRLHFSKSRKSSSSFPQLYPVHSSTQGATLRISRKETPQQPLKAEDSHKLFLANQTAEKFFNKAMKALFGKKLLALGAKAVTSKWVSDQTKSKEAGYLAWFLLNLADQPDLRQWSTLPNAIHMNRIPLPAGSYQVELKGFNVRHELTGENSPKYSVTIQPKQKTFLVWRSF